MELATGLSDMNGEIEEQGATQWKSLVVKKKVTKQEGGKTWLHQTVSVYTADVQS